MNGGADESRAKMTAHISKNGGKGSQEKTGFKLGNGQGLVGSSAESSQV